ncbi:MAG: carboxymuconolactone decarboxylase family protein [Acidobacteria bacterium]|nr:carboxymuconolactone decarboxylase family protein [Acidobacteriota bacterium]
MSDSKDSIESRIDEIAAFRRESEYDLRDVSPVYASQMESTTSVFGEQGRKGGLAQVHRILIALGTAVQAGSESTIDWTITRALNHGANEAMILDAIDVALLNGGNFTVANARFAYRALKYRLSTRPAGSEEEFPVISTPGHLRAASGA